VTTPVAHQGGCCSSSCHLLDGVGPAPPRRLRGGTVTERDLHQRSRASGGPPFRDDPKAGPEEWWVPTSPVLRQTNTHDSAQR
jgi:hypothetical protein